MSDLHTKNQVALTELHKVIDQLLGENGCKWDKAQTARTLTEYMIEECFEYVSAIRHDDLDEMRDELGDLLFILCLSARIEEKNQHYSLADALEAATAKMIRRHPHVFADANFAKLEDFQKAWEGIKRAEKAEKDNSKQGIFSGLPKELPPLTKAYRLHSKSATCNFTWVEDSEVEQQVEAEWLELIDAIEAKDQKAIEHELGDMFFTLVELARRHGFKAAEVLEKTNQRFLKRFETMEELAKAKNLEFHTLDLDTKDELWDEAKAKEKA